MKLIDITGQRFGRLIVIERDRTKKATYWNCLCECGNKISVMGKYLRNGKTTSCGCYHKEMLSQRSKTHGLTGKRLYRIWANMKNRCLNKNVNCFPYYGGRGIAICDEWLQFDNFMKWSLSNGYDEKLTLDRINNNGNYEPLNCRWVTMKEQCQNRRKRGTALCR